MKISYFETIQAA